MHRRLAAASFTALAGLILALLPQALRPQAAAAHGIAGDRVVTWGLSLQYSLPYLDQHVRAMTGAPDFIRQLTPIIEASFETPVSHIGDEPRRTTDTINPGLIWANGAVQVGVEALSPINAASGSHVGVIGQQHVFLDDIFPNTLGKPLFP